MAETLRELVVALSLDSSNFSRNMRTINQQIKEAESTFRLAGAGVENYEKTIAGTEAKLSMLGQKLTQQQRAVEQYSRASGLLYSGKDFVNLFSSGHLFRGSLQNSPHYENLHCRVLFYTTLEVYTKFRIVSGIQAFPSSFPSWLSGSGFRPIWTPISTPPPKDH